MNDAWTMLGRCVEREPFVVGGVDVWGVPWRETSERVAVADAATSETFRFSVYEIDAVGGPLRFAAGETSPGVWGFATRP